MHGSLSAIGQRLQCCQGLALPCLSRCTKAFTSGEISSPLAMTVPLDRDQCYDEHDRQRYEHQQQCDGYMRVEYELRSRMTTRKEGRSGSCPGGSQG
jgi:hypothetical protein